MYLHSLSWLEVQENPSLLEVFALGASVLTLIALFHGSQLRHIVRAFLACCRQAFASISIDEKLEKLIQLAITH